MVKIGQSAIGFDPANAKQAVINLVIVKHCFGFGADDVAVGQTQRPAGYNNPIAGIIAQRHGGIHVVGDDRQMAVIDQIQRDKFQRAANADQDRRPIGDQVGNMKGYGVLWRNIGDLTTFIRQVHARFPGIFHPAVTPPDKVGIIKDINVASHGLRRYIKMIGQRINGGKSITPQDVDNVTLSR